MSTTSWQPHFQLAAEALKIVAHELANPLAKAHFLHEPVTAGRKLHAAIPELSQRYAGIVEPRNWLVLSMQYDPTPVDFMRGCFEFARHPLRTLFSESNCSHISGNFHFSTYERKRAIALLEDGIHAVQWSKEESLRGEGIMSRMDVLGPPDQFDCHWAAYSTTKEAAEKYIEAYAKSRGRALAA